MTRFEEAVIKMLKLDANNITKLTITIEAQKLPIVQVTMLSQVRHLFLLKEEEIQEIRKTYTIIENEGK